MEGLKLLWWLRKFLTALSHEARPQMCHQNTEPTAMDLLRRVKSQFLKMLHEDVANDG
jgi:hypothetical protein